MSMNHTSSSRAPVPEADVELDRNGVHIRCEHKGSMIYAVFDGEEQVSGEHGPLSSSECLVFAEAYKQAKGKYED